MEIVCKHLKGLSANTRVWRHVFPIKSFKSIPHLKIL